MTDTDPETRRVAELLGSFDAGRTPDLDLSRVTRRGARMRTARQLEAAAAVLTVVVVVVGSALILTGSPQAHRQDAPAGPTSASASPVPVTGTAGDWRASVERAMPFRGQLRFDSNAPKDGPFTSTDDSASLAGIDYVQEWFRYTSGGRTTALIVTAQSGGFTWADRHLGCARLSTNCYPDRQTPMGPVLVENATEHGSRGAINLRPSGRWITVTSMPYDVTADDATQSAEIGLPAGLDADQLITLITRLPEPALGNPSPTPSPSVSDVSLSPLVGTGAIPASPVFSVAPGDKVPVDGTEYMTLTRSQECVLDSLEPVTVTPGTNPWCKSLTDGNQASDSVSMQTQGDSSRLLVTGIYLGDGADTVVVGSGPSARIASIVRVRGTTGPVAYFANLPPGGSLSQPMTQEAGRSVVVYDAHGNVLARL